MGMGEPAPSHSFSQLSQAVKGLTTHIGARRSCVRLPPATCGQLCGRHVLYDERLAWDAPWWLCCESILPCLCVCLHFGIGLTQREINQPFLVYRVYQIDYNRADKRFRMLDRLKPREMADSERPRAAAGHGIPL